MMNREGWTGVTVAHSNLTYCNSSQWTEENHENISIVGLYSNQLPVI